MKGIRFLLVPATVAWFAGTAWYMTRQNTCNCLSSGSTIATGPSTIHLGPATLEGTAAEPAAAAAAVIDAATTPVLSGSASFEPLLTVRFLKNTQEVKWAAEELRWCESVRAYLLANTAATVTVTGHTDGDGEAALNERLSLRRAQVVRTGLIDLGLPAERISAIGAGAVAPIADNTTSKGKALNRRVEIHVDRNP